MKYEINGCLKFSELDIYDDGCQLEGGSDCFIPFRVSTDSKEDALQQCMEFCSVSHEDDAVELDACEEPGRIDIARTENSNGDQLSPSELEQWKRGEIKAWYCIYTFRLESVERSAASLLCGLL